MSQSGNAWKADDYVVYYDARKQGFSEHAWKRCKGASLALSESRPHVVRDRVYTRHDVLQHAFNTDDSNKRARYGRCDLVSLISSQVPSGKENEDVYRGEKVHGILSEVFELTWERKDQMRSRELKRNGNVMVVNCEHPGERYSEVLEETEGAYGCKALETDLRQTKKVYGDAFTRLIKKGMSMIEEIDQDTGIYLVQTNAEDHVTPTKVSAQEEAHTQQDQPEDHLRILKKRRAVSTGSGEISTAKESVSTAGASMPVSTAGMVQEASTPSSVATMDNGKAIMQESESPKKMKQREQIQISRDEEIALKLQEEFDAAERQRIARVHEEASTPSSVATKDKGKTIMQESESPKKMKQRDTDQLA
ncbi:hypothetical protein Tco_1214468 [Tanacetum coccineum]